jgi:4-hydroxy-3-methylbut-2-enyl diphosphate reductase IspH
MAKDIVSQLARIKAFTISQLEQIDRARKTNRQVSDAFGVPDRIRELFAENNFKASDDAPDDEIPF